MTERPTGEQALAAAVQAAEGRTDVREIMIALLRRLEPVELYALIDWGKKHKDQLQAVHEPTPGASVVSSSQGVLWLKTSGLPQQEARVLAALAYGRRSSFHLVADL